MTSTTDNFDDEYDEYDGFDEEDEERGVSGLVVLLIILAMLVAFSFIVWLAYNKGLRTSAQRDVPQIAADPEPVKIVTNEAGAGTSEEREVYDRFDGNANTQSEVLTDGPEEPILPETSDPIADLAAAADTVGDSVEAAAAGATNVTNNAVNAVKDVASDTVAAGNEAVEYAQQESDQLTSVIRDAVSDGGAVVSTATPEPTGVTPPTQASSSTPASVSVTRGTHVVQVGAFRSEEEADGFWNQLNTRFDDYLDGKYKDIERADLGSRGIFYRLRIAGFDSKDAATSYCTGLKARKQDCLVKAL